MARPSNRGVEREDNKNKGKSGNYFLTAIYIRLSYESYYSDSESIDNQKLLLREYLQKNKELVLQEQYIDDGKTGTNFDRPAFERMMKAIREGSINCIVVKDVSRFGRDHVEVGDYIERIFPFLGVRFISINDEYDSFNPACDKEQLLLSVKNLMHEMYARDVSIKISSAIKIKQNQREFYKTAIIPYGYRSGGSEYEIDEQAARVVRRIFHSFASGDTIYHICSDLNKEGFTSPKEYKTSKSVYTIRSTDSCWNASTVKRMLINEVYIGNMIRHKSEQDFYNNKKIKKIAKKDWIRAENTHPPIIDQVVFMQVQRRVLQTNSKVSRKTSGSTCSKRYRYDENIFKNKIFCGACSTAMNRIHVESTANKDTFIHKGFSCGLHRRCISKCGHKEIIGEEVLCNLINRIIVEQTKLYKEICLLIRKRGEEIFNKERVSVIADRNVIISDIRKHEMAKIDALEEYHQGKINKLQVMMKRSEIQNLIKQCKERDKLLEERLLEVNRLENEYNRMMNEWLRYTQNPKITKEVIGLFVKRIDVYPQKRVVIKLKQIDYVKESIQFACDACKGGENIGCFSNIFEAVKRGL